MKSNVQRNTKLEPVRQFTCNQEVAKRRWGFRSIASALGLALALFVSLSKINLDFTSLSPLLNPFCVENSQKFQVEELWK